LKKILFSAITALLLSFPAFSLNNEWGFEIEPYCGVRNTLLNEYVYGKNSQTGEEYQLSLLNWNLKNQVYAGFNTDVRFMDFHLAGNFKGLLQNYKSSMDDSDWMQDAGYKTGNTSIKTNYSEHELNFVQGFNVDAKALYDFKPAKGLTLSPSIAFSYETYTLTANNGTTYYGYGKNGVKYSYFSYDDTAHRSVTQMSGEVIKLERYDYYTWIGFDVKYTTPDNMWKFGISAEISPWAYIFSRDSHEAKGVYYIDIGQGFFSAYRASAFVQFNLDQHCGIKFLADGMITGELKGNDYTSGSYNGTFKNNGPVSGSATRYFDFQLSAVVSF